MNGLTLVSGINYSGKGTFLNLLKNEWEVKNGHESAFFESASHVMMRLGGLQNHSELGNISRYERDQLRLVMLAYVKEQALQKPFFLDMHFIFEDGERPDYSLVIPELREILSIVSDPEVILKRKEKDLMIGEHPGRGSLKTHDFIDFYQRAETCAMQDYADLASQKLIRSIPITTIVNNYTAERELAIVVREISPRLELSFREKPRISRERF